MYGRSQAFPSSGSESLHDQKKNVLDGMSQNMKFYSCYFISKWLGPSICLVPQNCTTAENSKWRKFTIVLSRYL